MNIVLNQTHHTIADFDAIFATLKEKVLTSLKNDEKTVHIFPELFLTGYPLQDLCLNKSFVVKYHDLISKINKWSKSLAHNTEQLFLMGGIHYYLDQEGNIRELENVIFKFSPGESLEAVYSKILLPNYDIFDEKKYFSPGKSAMVLDFFDKKIGLLLCEDMWPSSAHKLNPVELLKAAGTKLDLVINLSASPFDLAKNQKRFDRGVEISKFLNAPFAYVNRVGGEDEIIFDGGSFYVSSEKTLKAKFFEPDTLEVKVTNNTTLTNTETKEDVPSTWEGLFEPSLIKRDNGEQTLKPLSDANCEDLITALNFGIQEYAKKSYFKKFVIALSGGMDSALVLTILKLGLKEDQELEAIYMPSEYSRDISESLSRDLCANLEIPLKILPIKKIHNEVRHHFSDFIGEELSGISDENIQSRLRGALLYARSNQSSALVVNTSNKSELAVGYSTIYGDSVGAISLLGDLYKSEVFALANFINRKYNNIIPKEIITRPPSAELRDDQEDTDSLPAYDRLDTILEGILSYRMTANDITKLGLKSEEVEQVIDLYRKSEFKRAQFCPILKVKAKSFGFGYRVPLSKKSDFYL